MDQNNAVSPNVAIEQKPWSLIMNVISKESGRTMRVYGVVFAETEEAARAKVLETANASLIRDVQIKEPKMKNGIFAIGGVYTSMPGAIL